MSNSFTTNVTAAPVPLIGTPQQPAAAPAPSAGAPTPMIGTVTAAPTPPQVAAAAPTAPPAPVIGTVNAPTTPAAPPATVIGTMAVPSAPPAPVIGTVSAPSAPPGGVPIRPSVPIPAEVYEPPTTHIPDAPPVPGKWIPEYSRDYKSYVVPGLDGIRSSDTVSRATSHAKVLGDDSNLLDWKMSATVLGLARNPELLDNLHVDGAMHLSDLDFAHKRQLKWIGNQAARRVGADDGAEFGTKLHGYLEAVVEGVITLDEVPEPLRGYLIVMFQAMARNRLSFVGGMCERTVFIPDTNSVGTLDFMTIDDHGVLMIGDLKTSGSIDYSWLSIGVQLAQYSNATLMLSLDGTCWEPMPAVSQVVGKVLSVPKDVGVPTARVYTVNLELGAEMMRAASRVREIQEAARRGASNPERYTGDDPMMAWADDDAVTLFGPADGAVA